MEEEICLQSQELVEVPSTVFKGKVNKLNLDFNDIVSLPLSLCSQLTDLTVLSLNGNMLETLPENIHLLSGLTDLCLKENCLVDLPDSIVKLKNLKTLHLTGNNIQKLPENIHLLENLTELLANDNLLTTLPSSFGNLKCLSFLNLSYNEIEDLPDGLGGLESLKLLDLANNSLKFLPETFKDLPCLEDLNLTGNNVMYLPDTFQSAPCLQRLFAADNWISEIPQWFVDMKSIQEINLRENNLHGVQFPDDFGSFSLNLEHLDLSGNNITSLPQSIGKLKSLSFLDLGSSFDELERNMMISNGNDIKILPDAICDLKNLSRLELDENQIEELPRDFGLLENLVYLDLGHNMLHSLPESFGLLSKLKVLMLSMNFLTRLPESFGMLTSIRELKLDSNKLEKLPESFKNLTGLIYLDLFHNNLKEIPKLDHIKYLRTFDLRENEFGTAQDNLVKVIEPRYVARDPKLADNWRGRKRTDIPESAWVEAKPRDLEREKIENEIFNDPVLLDSTILRKHEQSDIRSRSIVTKTTPPRVNQEHSAETVQTQSLENEYEAEKEKEYWDEDVESNVSTRSSTSSISKESVPDEFKDAECETEYKLDLLKNFTRTYHPIPNNVPSEVNEPFIPSDLHVSSACAPEIWDIVEDGQFDDA